MLFLSERVMGLAGKGKVSVYSVYLCQADPAEIALASPGDIPERIGCSEVEVMLQGHLNGKMIHLVELETYVI